MADTLPGRRVKFIMRLIHIDEMRAPARLGGRDFHPMQYRDVRRRRIILHVRVPAQRLSCGIIGIVFLGNHLSAWFARVAV